MTRKLNYSLNVLMKYLILFFVMFFPYHASVAGLLLNTSNNSLSVIDSPNSVDVSGVATFNSGSNLWEYRYKISEVAGSAISNAQFVIKEDESHENLHHEQDILIGNSNFQWDGTQRPGGNPFYSMLHNYSWSDISIAANSDIFLGFDDKHGPSLERWQIYLGGATPNYIQVTAQPMQLPVPSILSRVSTTDGPLGIGGVIVPEPRSLVLLLTSLFMIYCLSRARVSAQKH